MDGENNGKPYEQMDDLGGTNIELNQLTTIGVIELLQTKNGETHCMYMFIVIQHVETNSGIVYLLGHVCTFENTLNIQSRQLPTCDNTWGNTFLRISLVVTLQLLNIASWNIQIFNRMYQSGSIFHYYVS